MNTDALTILKMLGSGRAVPFVAAAVGLSTEEVLALAAEHGATRPDGSVDAAVLPATVAMLEGRGPAIPTRQEVPPTAGVKPMRGLALVPVGLIDADGRNVRDELGDLTELACSIRSVGILQPLTVSTRGNRYGLVYGHRRLGAALIAGLTEVPCIVRGPRPESATRIERLIENLHRKALAPMEEATAYRILLGDGLTQSEIARRVGVSAATVSSRLSLLELPAEAQAMVRDRRLPVTEASALAKQVRASGSGSVGNKAPALPDFWATHPLRDEAYRRCAHWSRRRYGGSKGGCGPCWEAVIRGDEGLRLLTTPHREDHPR